MAATQTPPTTTQAHRTVFVETFTDGLLGPDVADGSGRWPTAATSSSTRRPGCWGPMITPAIRGGHEVSTPVAVAGAEVGDAIAIRIRDIEVTSLATARATTADGGPLQRRPVLRPGLPGLRHRVAADARRGHRARERCAAPTAAPTRRPFTFTNGYTIAFDDGARPRRHRRARGGRALRRATPRASRRCPTARSRTRSSASPRTTSSALATRLRPFMGQLGTSPSATIPDSHNAGDFGAFLLGAPHRFAMTRRGAPAPQDRRPHGHRRGARRRDPRLPGEGRGRRRLHGRHARAAGRRRDRRAHLRRLRHRDPAGRGAQGPRHRRARALPGRGGPAVPGAAAERRRARAGGRAGARATASDELEESLPISVVGTGPTSTPPPTTAWRAPPSCST